MERGVIAEQNNSVFVPGPIYRFPKYARESRWWNNKNLTIPPTLHKYSGLLPALPKDGVFVQRSSAHFEGILFQVRYPWRLAAAVHNLSPSLSAAFLFAWLPAE